MIGYRITRHAGAGLQGQFHGVELRECMRRGMGCHGCAKEPGPVALALEFVCGRSEKRGLCRFGCAV